MTHKPTAHREFWIDSDSFAHDSDSMKGFENWTRNDSLIHTIEMSAVQDLLDALEMAQAHIRSGVPSFGTTISTIEAALTKFREGKAR